MYCYLCEIEYVGIRHYWCPKCRKIKNLMNCYGRDRILTILETCCLRNEEQLETKILKTKQIKGVKPEATIGHHEEPMKTRSKKP